MVAGCDWFKKSDDDMPYYLRVNGEDNELNSGLYENFGLNEDGATYEIHVSLFSSGIIVEGSGRIDTVYGAGNIIYFEIITSAGTIIDDGEYPLDPNKALKTFRNAQYKIGWNSDVRPPYVKLTSGTVTMLRSGNVYEVRFDGLDEFGLTVSAYYKGTLNYFTNP